MKLEHESMLLYSRKACRYIVYWGHAGLPHLKVCKIATGHASISPTLWWQTRHRLYRGLAAVFWIKNAHPSREMHSPSIAWAKVILRRLCTHVFMPPREYTIKTCLTPNLLPFTEVCQKDMIDSHSMPCNHRTASSSRSSQSRPRALSHRARQ